VQRLLVSSETREPREAGRAIIAGTCTWEDDPEGDARAPRA